MGYESRIIIANVTRFPETHFRGKINPALTFAEEIASIKMGCMDSSFLLLFNKEIDYLINKPGTDEQTMVDCYGKCIKSGNINEIIQWLEDKVKDDDYRRLNPLLGLLKGFNTEQWNYSENSLEVLHYGY